MQVGIYFICILLSLFILYLYYKIKTKKNNLHKNEQDFYVDLKDFLINTYPRIDFKYEIFEQKKDFENIKLKKETILNNILHQFMNFNFIAKTQDPIKRSSLWLNYEIDSIAIKNKIPKDIKQRKELAWKRSKDRCERCGLLIKFEESHIHYVRKISQKGSYHLENICIICNDCSIIEEKKDINETVYDLEIEQNLQKRFL